MIRNYLKTAIRMLFRQKSYSFINIGGLAIGMSVCILILTYIFYELSFDKFHEKNERVYRLCVDANIGGTAMNLALTSGPMGHTILEDFPEVINQTRILQTRSRFLVAYEDHKFYEDNLYYADSSFFDLFSFKLLRGNPKEVLAVHNGIVLTEKLAEKYFGKEDPIGKVLRINDNSNLTVTGLLKNVPGNSHFQFDALISTSGILNNPQYGLQSWGDISLNTYLLLDENVDYLEFQKKFPDFEETRMGFLKQANVVFDLYLQPLSSIHLHSHLRGELGTNGDIKYIYIFSAIAIFILLIACINYMNLASARSFKRAKEVGMRKIHGAIKGQLVRQFLSESVLLSFIALAISVVIVKITLPMFSDLVLTEGNLDIYQNLFIILVFFLALTAVVGLLAGSYPAFYLSSFRPISALKGGGIVGKKKSIVRNILVVLQFAIATVLIISTGIIYSQLNYMNHKDLGFNKENKMVIPLRNQNVISKIQTLKSEFENLSVVENVSIVSSLPGSNINGRGYHPEGKDPGTPIIMYNFTTDANFFNTFEMEFVEGRGFLKEAGTDSLGIVINQTLQKQMEWENPIGKIISTNPTRTDSKQYKVIGVVKDFHYTSLLDQIGPLLIHYAPAATRTIVLNLNDAGSHHQIEQVRAKWNELVPEMPLDYSFVKENFERRYRSYLKMGKLFTTFSIIAIFVACIGLFGLASFLTEIRTKEIGIRKVNGASITNIVRLLNYEFIKWVIIANIIAWPVAYYFMTDWIQNFSYRINISWYYFVIGAIFSLIIALVTVSYQTIRAASRNPIESLRYE